VSGGELTIGCMALRLGVGLIAGNKPYGRSLERWNARGLPRINRMAGGDRLLRPTNAGHYPFIIGLGVLAILIGLMALLIGLA
jgi:hypothetical protein